MKNIPKNFLLILLMTFNIQILSQNTDYSKMSQGQLDKSFIIAAYNENINAIKELEKTSANFNTPIPYEWTHGDCDWQIESHPILFAIRKHKNKLFEALLKAKSKIINCKKELVDALDEAIQNGSSWHVQKLIEAGAHIHHIDENGETFLMKAVSRNKLHIAKVLMKAKSSIKHTNNRGKTALMIAVENHNIDIVKMLLKTPEMHQAAYFGFGTLPINYADEDGNTALLLAAIYMQYSYYNQRSQNICINSQKIVEELSKVPGIDPWHKNNNGDTAVEIFKKKEQSARRY